MIISDNVATLIHDIKNPIIAQERVLDLLLHNAFGKLNNSQTEVISLVKETNTFLKNLVRRAMDNYLSNSDKIEYKFEKFNFSEIIYTLVKEFQPLAEQENKKILLSCDNSFIYADKFQMKRVISNLLGNAIKYSLKNSEIEIKSQSIGTNFLFTVKNKSLPINNLNNVFNKFESTTNSGLGLYLVKKIITGHKGSVFAKEETSEKYSFGFVIPNI